MIGSIFEIVGALGVFLYGMRVMSDGIQKVAGDRLQSVLNFMTKNRVIAVFSGFMITAIVQSSSATTVMIVSFVNAGLLNLTQSIGVIMGANIGTTVTTWIVSIIGFKFKIAAFALPIIAIGLPLMFSKKTRYKELSEVFIGFGLLFLGLMFLKNAVPDIKSHPEFLEFLKNYTEMGFLSYLIFLAAGTILTIVVQSSSAAMAITVTMAFMGWIDFKTSAAIVLGENIGTTVTAYLAAIGTSVNARRAARAHLLFNIFGVIWVTFIFSYFVDFILAIAPWDSSLQENLPLNLSLFHTVFNVSNTLISMPLLSYFAIVVTKLIKESDEDISKEYKFKFVSTAFQETPQVHVINAKAEVAKMAKVTREMISIFTEIFSNPEKKMGGYVVKAKELENLTDKMQEEISDYLVECFKEDLSQRNINDITAMMRIAHELENIGDASYKLVFITRKKYEKKIKFTDEAMNEIKDFTVLVASFVDFCINHLGNNFSKEDLKQAYNLEEDVNQFRNRLNKNVRHRLKQGAYVRGELFYLDISKYLEHIGDHSLNIAQALKEMN
jgi:phosphate:Na+ symporter